MQEETDAALPPLLVRQSATPLIALRGMTDFNHELSERMPMVRAVPIEQLPYVTQKERRPTFEGVKASGILKARWLEKHVLEEPSAIAVLLPWTDGDVDRMMADMRTAAEECAHRPFGTRLVTILVASGAAGINFHAQYQTLMSRIEMDPRLICLVVRESEAELKGGADRVEQALLLAAGFFFDEAAKWSQQVLSSLNRREQLDLIVRHGFKAAFYLEHREISAALRQYMAAYNDLLELSRAVGRDRHIEVKRVAEVINFKVCRLTLHTISAKAAQAQLLRHVSHLKSMTGGDDRVFEHLAYLARQHVVFGELVKEAAKAGVQNANGGLHWEAAAWLLGRRESEGKRAVSKADAAADAAVAKEVEQLLGVGYWGQERHVGASRHLERSANYGAMLEKMWEEAVAEYQHASQPRRALYCKVQYARLLFAKGRYAETAPLLDAVLQTLDGEGWGRLSADVAALAVDVSRALRRMEPFVVGSLRVLDRRLPAPVEVRQRLQDDLGLLVAGFPLELPPHSQLRTHPKEVQDMQWATLTQPLECPNENGGVSLISFQASFAAPSYVAGQEVTLVVRVTSHLHAPLKASSIQMDFSDARYNITLRPSETIAQPPSSPGKGADRTEIPQDDMVLLPGKERVFRLGLRAEVAVEALSCSSLSLDWGLPPSSLRLRALSVAAPDPRSALSPQLGPTSALSPQLKPVMIKREPSVSSGGGGVGGGTRMGRKDGWAVTTVGAAKPEARVTLESEAPALISEYHRVMIRVECMGGRGLKGASLRVSAGGEERVQAEVLQADGKGGVQKLDPLDGVTVPDLPQGGSHSTEVLLLLSGDGGQACTVRAQLQYEGEGGENGMVEEVMSVLAVPAMTVAGSYSALSELQLLGNNGPDGGGAGGGGMVVMEGEAVMARVVLDVAAPHKLLLEGAELRLNQVVAKEEAAHSLDSWEPALKAPIVLAAGDRFCFQFPLIFCGQGDALSPGSVALRWSRAVGASSSVTNSPSAVTTFKLPEVSVKARGLVVRTLVPPQGVLGEKLAVELEAKNKTDDSVEYQVEAQPSESFLLAGFRSTKVRVLPRSSLRLAFNLVPISVGLLHPPKILLKWKRDGQDVQQAVSTAKVFIQPPDFNAQE